MNRLPTSKYYLYFKFSELLKDNHKILHFTSILYIILNIINK